MATVSQQAVGGIVYDIMDKISRTSVEPIDNFEEMGAQTLAGGENFNNLTEPGVYMAKSNAIAETLANCPSVYAGLLAVYRVYTNSSITQRYVDVIGSIYIRSIINGVFDVWRTITRRYIPVANSADFNDFTEDGYYTVGSTSTARTLANCPSLYAGVLHVYHTSGSATGLIQEYTDNSGEVFIRAYVSGAFTPYSNYHFDCVNNTAVSFSNFPFYRGWIKTDGSTIDPSSITDSGDYKYAVLPCTAGDRFLVNGEGAGAARLWAFADDEGNNLYKAEDTKNTAGGFVIVEAPEDAAYAVFNVRVRTPYYIYVQKNGNVAAETSTDVLSPAVMKYGFYNASGIYTKVYNMIVTREHIPEYVQSFTMTGSTCEVCVVVWKKDGTLQGRNFWYQQGDSFVFAHDRFDYDIYIRKIDEGTIGDWAAALAEMTLTVNKKVYSDYIEDLKRKNAVNEAYINEIASTIHNMKKNSEYNISFANAIRPLQFTNYVGDSQQMHPSVLYFPNTFAGFKY